MRNVDMPTFPAKSCTEFWLDNALLFSWEHESHVSSDSIINDNKRIYALIGTAVDLDSLASDAKSIYTTLDIDRNSDSIQGDYLCFSIDEYGNGKFFNPLMSFNRLFMYETNDFYAFSSEIRLIYNSIEDFRKNNKSVIDNFNYNFIYDSIENEWGTRAVPNETFIKGITRIPTTTFLEIKNWEVSFHDNQFKMLDLSLENKYLTNKDEFYDYTFSLIHDANQYFLSNILNKNIEILMSGGLDSRLNIAILNYFKESLHLTLTSKSYGPIDHPDVEIGQICAETLSIPFKNLTGDGKLYYPETIEDYYNCASLSQGDWNSNNFRTSRVFVQRIVISGQDNYKRHNWAKIFGMNRWYAARMNYTKTLPIISLPIVNKMALVYGKHIFHNGLFEFSYELLKRFSPDLLEIPLVGMSIPQHYIEPYKTVKESKIMPSHLARAYFDQNLVIECLNLGSNISTVQINQNEIFADERKRRIAMDYASFKNKYYI